MMLKLLLAAAGILAGSPLSPVRPVVQIAATAPVPDARNALQRAADGSVRLDRQTGALSNCRADPAGALACTSVADDRAALESEIARLKAENDALAQRLAAGAGVRGGPAAAQAGDTQASGPWAVVRLIFARMIHSYREMAGAPAAAPEKPR
jgi:hypothetical protein